MWDCMGLGSLEGVGAGRGWWSAGSGSTAATGATTGVISATYAISVTEVFLTLLPSATNPTGIFNLASGPNVLSSSSLSSYSAFFAISRLDVS